jgi:hypothetical protein
MAYNRDVLIACVQRHYGLLVRFAYLNPDAIETPPPSGWTDEQLASDILQLLGHDEKVIDLLRHQPYLKFQRYEPTHESTTRPNRSITCVMLRPSEEMQPSNHAPERP